MRNWSFCTRNNFHAILKILRIETNAVWILCLILLLVHINCKQYVSMYKIDFKVSSGTICDDFISCWLTWLYAELSEPSWSPNSTDLYFWYLFVDQHRNTNMKNKDHLGGQLTSLKVAAPGSACCRGGRAQCKMAKRQKYKEKDKKYNYRNTV